MNRDEWPWEIVIAERNWIYVGRVGRDGDMTIIHNAQNVRRWGTTEGLGELARKGPRPETVLDAYGTVKIHVLAVVGHIECDAKTWDAWSLKVKK